MPKTWTSKSPGRAESARWCTRADRSRNEAKPGYADQRGKLPYVLAQETCDSLMQSMRTFTPE